MVLRLLDKSNLQLDMTKLGFEDPKPSTNFQRGHRSPYGMVLVTGPTGSGKTTTLYSALAQPRTMSAPNIMHRGGSGRVRTSWDQPDADAARTSA